MAEPASASMSGPAYVRLVGIGALIGVPAALVAVGFLALTQELEHWLWEDLPDALGASSPPWYLIVGLPVIGACLVLASRRLLPGDGGHSPIGGLDMARRRSPTAPGSPSPRSARSRSVPSWDPRRR